MAAAALGCKSHIKRKNTAKCLEGIDVNFKVHSTKPSPAWIRDFLKPSYR